MAVAAHEAAFIVRAAVPVRPITFLVAAEANRVGFFRRARQVVGAERNDPSRTAPAAGFHVRGARAMTIFTIKFDLLGLADLAHQRAAERFGLAGMAAQTNLRADVSGRDLRT